MIFCLGSVAEETFAYTLMTFERANLPFIVIDLAELIARGDLEIPLNNPEDSRFICGDQTIRLSDMSACFVRLVDLSSAAPNARLKARSFELFSALAHLFSVLNIPTISPPVRDCSNVSKVYHSFLLASQLNLEVPRSLLTQSPEQAEAFIASCLEGAIFKGTSNTKTWATAYDPIQHDARLELISHTPVLFQERIVGPDVRVHVVGTECFAESIFAQGLDYRIDKSNRYESISLPSNIQDACAKLTTMLGAPFIGVDFKINLQSGIWFFLEANSMPCYHGYDARAGFGISKALVRWLRQPSLLYRSEIEFMNAVA
jgi:glutathione synthase/RimK-type ligase-like ATP-grasp enzyme